MSKSANTGHFLSFRDALLSLEKRTKSSFHDLAHALHMCIVNREKVYAIWVHEHMKRTGLQDHVVVGNGLVSLLVEAGNTYAARQVFDSLSWRNDTSWNALINGYIKCGMLEHALILFHNLHRDDSPLLNGPTFVELLRACAKIKDLKSGVLIHLKVVSIGSLEHNLFISSSLIDMYVKCYAVDKAQGVFVSLLTQDVVTWTSMLAGYAENGNNDEALNCFERMQLEGICPNVITYTSVLKSCSDIEETDKCKRMHVMIETQKLVEYNLLLGNTLIYTYAKLGAFILAQEVLDQLPIQDVVSRTALISGYIENGYDEKALNCLAQMQFDGLLPDAVTLICCLTACGNIGDVEKGQMIHAEIARRGLFETKHVGNALLGMYLKLGLFPKAAETSKKIAMKDSISWNAIICGYAESGHGHEALEYFKQMEIERILPNTVTLVGCLKACSSVRAIEEGQKIHMKIVKLGQMEENEEVGSTLVDMYVKCGFLFVGRSVFDQLTIRGVVSWTTLISGFVDHGHYVKAFELFQKMQVEGISPNEVAYVFILKACSSIGTTQGQQIHVELQLRGLSEGSVVIGNSLVDMYANLGHMFAAQHMFDKMEVRDEVSWTMLIAGYVDHGYADLGLRCFYQMKLEGVSPNCVTFIHVLRACGRMRAIDVIKELHDVIEREGLLERDIKINDCLLYSYAKCGCLLKVCEVFNACQIRNVVSWNTLISAYVEQDDGQKALECFGQMHRFGVYPNVVTYIHSLKACISIGNSDRGQEIHAEIEKRGLLEGDVLVHTALVDMYAKCGRLVAAQKLFDEIPDQDVVSWTSLIAGYSSYGHSEESLDCFHKMCSQGICPNAVTFLASLEACGSIALARMGEKLHSLIEIQGVLHSDLIIGNAVISMYVKCKCLPEARIVLEKLPVRDVVSWTTLIVGYIGCSYNEEAIKCFERMSLEGVSFNSVTFIYCLKACNNVHMTRKGQELHAQIERQGLLTRHLTVGNTLVGMYGKFGFLTLAQQVFDKLAVRDTVSWAILISGYLEHGDSVMALKCFGQMDLEGISLDAVAFVMTLKACIKIGSLKGIYKIHSQMEKQGIIENNIIVGNSLIHAYAKLGFLPNAEAVFDAVPVRDLVSWNTLISGYAKLGKLQIVLIIFQRMLNRCIKPDSITFFSILSVCFGAGCSKVSAMCFEELSKDHGIISSFNHCVCMVNLLGCVGEFDKAVAVIKKMPYVPDLLVWHALLCASWRLGNSEHGKLALYHVLRLE